MCPATLGVGHRDSSGSERQELNAQALRLNPKPRALNPQSPDFASAALRIAAAAAGETVRSLSLYMRLMPGILEKTC